MIISKRICDLQLGDVIRYTECPFSDQVVTEINRKEKMLYTSRLFMRLNPDSWKITPEHDQMTVYISVETVPYHLSDTRPVPVVI